MWSPGQDLFDPFINMFFFGRIEGQRTGNPRVYIYIYIHMLYQSHLAVVHLTYVNSSGKSSCSIVIELNVPFSISVYIYNSKNNHNNKIIMIMIMIMIIIRRYVIIIYTIIIYNNILSYIINRYILKVNPGSFFAPEFTPSKPSRHRHVSAFPHIPPASMPW